MFVKDLARVKDEFEHRRRNPPIYSSHPKHHLYIIISNVVYFDHLSYLLALHCGPRGF